MWVGLQNAMRNVEPTYRERKTTTEATRKYMYSSGERPKTITETGKGRGDKVRETESKTRGGRRRVTQGEGDGEQDKWRETESKIGQGDRE